MSVKPTKVTQIVPGDTLTTAAPLPATINNDGRSTNLLGTEGAFLAAGPIMFGRGVLTVPQAVGITLTADQLFGNWLTVTGVGSNAIQLPGADAIVNFITTQFSRVPTVAWPNTGTAATAVQFYPAFMFRVTMEGTSQLNMGTRTLYFAQGSIGAGAPNTGALVAGSTNSYEVIITNSTPGAEAVRIVRV